MTQQLNEVGSKPDFVMLPHAVRAELLILASLAPLLGTPLDLAASLEAYDASLVGAGVTSACLPAYVLLTKLERCEVRGARGLPSVPERLWRTGPDGEQPPL